MHAVAKSDTPKAQPIAGLYARAQPLIKDRAQSHASGVTGLYVIDEPLPLLPPPPLLPSGDKNVDVN